MQRLSSLSSAAIVKAIHTLYTSHGYPEVHVTDNIPQFAGETFQQFLQNCSVHHQTSSPEYPQSNGEAERAVQTAKRLLESTTNLQDALLSYRTTPQASGFSPAELLYSRKVHNMLPAASDTLNPAWADLDKFRQSERRSKEDQQQRHDLRFGAKDLPPLSIGQRVWISDLDREGTVLEQLTERSYMDSTSKGNLRRNRIGLKVLVPSTPPDRHTEATRPPTTG